MAKKGVRPLVLLTGAGGNIGSGFREAYLRSYSKQYRLRLGVHNPMKLRDDRFDDVATLAIEDMRSVARACRGVDVIVHLAASPDWQGDFRAELHEPNIIGAYNVFEAAHKAGVRRIVYASSVHAIMGYPVDYQAHAGDPPRADTMYGVTKVFGEALCSSYAYEHSMSCIAIRIGAYVADADRQMVVESDNPQLLDIVISERDMTQLIHRCVVAPDSVRYAIVNGLSDNGFKRMDLESTRALLGYEPQDDAFEWTEKVDFGREEKV